MTFDAANPEPADSAGEIRENDDLFAAAPPAPLVLSGRDRFVVKLIDAAVKVGSEDFQQRYRPVTDELFTHHLIDPTAKPSYVQPDLEPVVDLETTEDPLEIIRLHLDSVIEDRQARDDARIGAEAELTVLSGRLSESEAHAAHLQLELDTQTTRAVAGEADAARLREELQHQVSTLTQQRETEVAALVQQRETEVAGLLAQHESDIGGLHERREAELGAVASDREAQVTSLHQQRENEISSLRGERDATIAGLHAQRETEVKALTTELADVRAQHDAQVTTLAADHDGRFNTMHITNDQHVADLRSAHEQQVNELSAVHEQHVGELIAEKESLAARLRGDDGDIEESLSNARAEINALSEARNQSNAQRDAAVEELDGAMAQRGEWENRLRLIVAALASTDDVGDWSDENAPDQRLVEFVRSTAKGYEQKLTRIEQLATEELVDESETNEYSIGANDAAVRILNALDDSDDSDDQ